MRQRSTTKFDPAFEQFEARQLLSATSLPAHVARTQVGSQDATSHAADRSGAHEASGEVAVHRVGATVNDRRQPTAPARSPGFLGFRVTNTPWQTPYKLVPPFQQVLVQIRQPTPGQVYNVCTVTVKNGTAQTFTAANNFTVRLNNAPPSFKGVPILTGNEQWKPGQILVFYVLTKKYYPVSFVSGGFQFDTEGRSWTAIPGPSGIFLRLKYNPATFARTLDWIVAYGQGNQNGVGAQFGLPNTSINQFVSAKTRRTDFAGHF